MLQNIGDKLKGQAEGGGRAHRWVYYLIIGALILVFAAWGPYSADLSLGGSSYAAKVNGETISIEEMNQQWQEQQGQLLQSFGGTMTDAQREAAQKQLLEASVQRLGIMQHANAVGFRISDAHVVQEFHNESAFQVDGQFNMETARARLAAAGISEREYVDDLRRRLLTNQLLGVVGISDFLTTAESQRILALLDEERELRYALLQPEDFAGKAAVEPAAIEAWYAAHKDNFAIPEAVKLAYAEMSLADVSSAVVVTEEQVKARYEQDKATYMQPETRKASHILIAVDGDTDDAKAAAEAADLAKQIKGGADFAALAQQHSSDTGSAANGGDLGWAGRDVYVPAFADKLFSMQQGEVSDPVKTEFGYHIIRLDGIRAAQGRSLDDVRAELTAALRNEEAVTEFNQRQDRLQELLERPGASFDQLVKEFTMRRGEVERFERGAGGLPLGSDAELNRDVFSDASLTQHRVGGPVQLGDDRITVFQVEEHFAASTQPLEEVRAHVVAELIRERGAEAALAAANDAVAKLGDGRSFEQVADSLKVKAEPAKYVGRGSPDLPVEIRDAVFAAARPAPDKPLRKVIRLDDGSVAVLQVTGWRVQSLSDNPQLVAMRAEREMGRYTRRDIEAYIGGVIDAAKVRINPDTFKY